MKKILLSLILLVAFYCCSTAQKYWTGLGTAGQWGDGNNWNPTGAPASGDDVILDNTNVGGSYTVTLPATSTTISVNTLKLAPAGNNIITLIIPSSNTADPGLSITGPGDALIINANGILQNSTGAPSGGIGMSIINTFRINNNGRYIHNNVRANATIVSQLSNVLGTEKGIFEYDVPGNLQYAISLSNRTYGSLVLSSSANSGNKTYTGNGGSDLNIKGNLIINTGANLNSSMTANINIAGDLTLNGNFDNSPSTLAAVSRSIIFNGTANQTISGTGNFTQGVNFRNVKMNKSSIITLARSITVNGDSVIVDTSARLNLSTYIINGASKFYTMSFSHLSMGDANGINVTGTNLGNIQTTIARKFDTASVYEYYGTGTQITGNALPSSVKNLIINKSDYNTVTLSQNVNINDSLLLQNGFLFSTNSALLTLRDTAGLTSPSFGYSRSFVLGEMNIEKNSISPANFSIGKINGTDTLFAPVSLLPANASTKIYTAEYFPQQYSDITTDTVPIDHVSKVEYWKIQSNLSGVAADAKVSLSWRPTSKIGDDTTAHNSTALSDLVIAHYIDDGGGLKWNMEGGGAATFTTFSVNGNANLDYGIISQLSHTSGAFFNYPFYTLGTKSRFNVLPVKLIDFNVQVNRSSIKLSWITEQETGIEKYVIEKSADGVQFLFNSEMSSLNKKSKWNYSCIDNLPLLGWNYYRLKIIDSKNKSYYSKIVRVLFEKDTSIIVSPNPASKAITINHPVSSSISTIDIVNSLGQIVKHLQTSSFSTTINIESLSKGMYLIRFRNQLNTSTQRFIKN